MNKINLIAASRERSIRMSEVILKWYHSASNPENIEFIISIDTTDHMVERYKRNFRNLELQYGVKIKLVINDNKNTVQAINAAKPHINGDIIFIISDDTDCFQGWDKAILDVVKDKNDYYIIKTNDGIGKDLITMPIFSRKYLDSKDYIYYPKYEHMFCDTELTCVAHLEGCIIDASNITFKHLHYTQGYHEKDHNDVKNQFTFYTGMEIFKERLGLNFEIPKEKQKGEIPKNIIEYINNN